MKFYISAKGIKRVTLSNSSASAAATTEKGSHATAAGGRRVSQRAALVLFLLLPFLFVKLALFVLDSATLCSSSLDCMAWRLFSRSDGTLLREELTRALLEARNSDEEGASNSIPESFIDLVKEITSNNNNNNNNNNKQNDDDIKAFAFETKAMMLKMEHLVREAKLRESLYWHVASRGLPKALHCLTLKLAEEYAANAMARSRLPQPELAFRLTDPSFLHIVLLTDNVLAASVVASSALTTSLTPEKLVFHIVTDKRTYASMHAWFALNPTVPAAIEVKGLHQFEWPNRGVTIAMKEMLQINRRVSPLQHLRIFIPEMFPDLNKVLFLEDDVVVARDLSPLWHVDLRGRVVGAVLDTPCGANCCPGRTYKDYFNFSDSLIALALFGLDDQCGWLYGMNIFDLQAWRKTTITQDYLRWLRHDTNSGFVLWEPGAVLPPALMAFEGHVVGIDPTWHVAGLGNRNPQLNWSAIQVAAVLHFTGPAKPWLEIAAPELRGVWYKHINLSNEYVSECGVVIG